MARAGTGRSNEEWVAALQARGAGADEAQADLRRLVLGALRKSSGRFGGVDEATLEDLAQVAVLRIIDKLDRFAGKSRFTTWAFSVALRTAFSELRKSQHSHPKPADIDTAGETVEDPGEAAATGLERAEIVDLLYRVIENDLTERQRTAILGELRGRPLEELETELGTNRNALYKLVHDARKKLRAGLEAAGISDDDVRQIFDL